MSHVEGEYCYFLNSEDLHDQESAMMRSTTPGGTMVLWRKDLDPHVSVYPVQTASFTPLVLRLPGHTVSVHIALYLPTHGRDSSFLSELASLQICVEELKDLYPGCIIFIRGDSNVSSKNLSRVSVLEQFQRDFSLKRVHIPHRTYHHFVGDGKFDSDIDLILHTAEDGIDEVVDSIICRMENPLVLSHHDIVISSVKLTNIGVTVPPPDLVSAPRITNRRTKTVWSHLGSEEYRATISPLLKLLREIWLDSTSTTCMSVLLNVTNYIMASIASKTNKTVSLNKKPVCKSSPTPPTVLSAKKQLTKAYEKLRGARSDPVQRQRFKMAQKAYRSSVRAHRVKEGSKRDEKLYSILTDNPSLLFKHIKSLRKTGSTAIQKLTVGQKIYEGETVPDGFFDSMTGIKSCDIDHLRTDPHLADKFSNYEHILKLCEDQHQIPAITRVKATKLLSRIKKNVKDYYSITALHYLNAGEEGQAHFHEVLNAIIKDVNHAAIEELNTAHGLVLYKGHNKDKTSDRAYRTISSCPFLAKALDLYLRDLYQELWDGCQAPTQYQGAGSSHELASLLITEVIQHSLYVKNMPVYMLSLDAQSAFDRCLRQILVNELHRAEIPGAAIAFINKRLENRATIYEWNGILMGPGRDITGFEQGGINSSDYYKLYNNEQLCSAQASGLGVDMNSCTVAATGQADDVVLTANDIDSLALLVRLTEKYCSKYRVTLVPSKTKLLAFHRDNQKELVYHARAVNPISIGGVPVEFVTEAEHVGVIRSVTGNLPNILNRITAHKKALGSVLSAGLAYGHRGNPAASLRTHKQYGTAVLFSGLASLVLTAAETRIIDQHFYHTVQRLQKLHLKTPRSLVLLMGGSLPGEAILHLKQLTLFLQICHLPNDPLHLHGLHVLVSAPNSARSWFQQIFALCVKYSLEHPHHLLCNPPPKATFRRNLKKTITNYWEDLLRHEASCLDSLQYFVPSLHSLSEPHPVWTTAGSNIYECHKSVLLARMMSGRFRTEYLSRHWSSNKQGYCLLATCREAVGDLEHLLITCPGLEEVRMKMRYMMLTKTQKLVPLNTLVLNILLSPPKTQLQFFMEPLAFTEILELHRVYGQAVLSLVFYCVRTYVYYVYRHKQLLLGNWSGDMTLKTKHGVKILTFKNQREQPVQASLPDTNLFPVAVLTSCGDPVHRDQPDQDCGDPDQPLQPDQEQGDHVQLLQPVQDRGDPVYLVQQAQDDPLLEHKQSIVHDQPRTLLSRAPTLDPSKLPTLKLGMDLPDGPELPTALDCVAGCVGDRYRVEPCSGNNDSQAPVTNTVASVRPVIGSPVGVADSCLVPSTVTISITNSSSPESCHTVV